MTVICFGWKSCYTPNLFSPVPLSLPLQPATSPVLVEAALNRACGEHLPSSSLLGVPSAVGKQGLEEATYLGQLQVIAQVSSKGICSHLHPHSNFFP